MLPVAPGSRAVIRDEEWLIRRVDPSTDGGWLLTCDGISISDLVRGQNALFLTVLEAAIEVLDPAATVLVPDISPTYSATRLYLESQRRRSVANDDRIHLGHRGVMNLVPYQLDPALQALRQPRARILIADSVGLGKTLEAGVLATELIRRGRGKRILVVTQKSMLTQFQKEWWSRFFIPLVRLDSVGLARVSNRIPANHNQFNHFDRSIIVIDECHNVAARAGEAGVSRRARLARLLATRSDTLILLSATPHDGSARSFASLMSLLDPTAISDPDDYTPDDFRNKGLVVRCFKKDIRDQVGADFQERVTTCLRQSASALEEAAYRALRPTHRRAHLHRPVRPRQPRGRLPHGLGVFCSGKRMTVNDPRLLRPVAPAAAEMSSVGGTGFRSRVQRRVFAGRRQAARQYAFCRACGFPAQAGQPDGARDGLVRRAVITDHAPADAQRLGCFAQGQLVAVHPLAKHLVTYKACLLNGPGVDVVCAKFFVDPLNAVPSVAHMHLGENLGGEDRRQRSVLAQPVSYVQFQHLAGAPGGAQAVWLHGFDRLQFWEKIFTHGLYLRHSLCKKTRLDATHASSSRISRAAIRPLISSVSTSTAHSRPSLSLTWTWGNKWSPTYSTTRDDRNRCRVGMACSIVQPLLYLVVCGFRHCVRPIGLVGAVTLIDWVEY